MKNSKKGISLIVLIITIIVMIVLAAAIILALNNSGIINKANEAVEVTDLAQVKNLAALKWSEAYLDENIKEKEDYEAYIEKGLKESGVNIDDYKIIVTENGIDIKEKIKYDNETPVPETWKENIVAIVDTVPIPKGFVASQATGEDTKNVGLVIYEGAEPVTDKNVETARRTRNQYVWVPVASEDFKTKFIRQNFGLSNVISNTLGTEWWEAALDLTNLPLAEQSSSYVTNETIEGGITNTLAEVQAMYASVKEYEGFYIARYEAGIDTKRTGNNGVLETNIYSMMGKIPYTCIPWTKSSTMDKDVDGAVQAARSIYPVTNTGYGVVSTLTYGVQWDSILQWWLDTNAVTSVRVSTDYGNSKNHTINSSDDLNDGALVAVDKNSDYTLDAYVSKDSTALTYPKVSGASWLLSTGALKVANVNNIYDMAGNVSEWTMEGFSTGYRVGHGGYFNSDGAGGVNGSVASRDWYNPNFGHPSFGFRVSLYVKK